MRPGTGGETLTIMKTGDPHQRLALRLLDLDSHHTAPAAPRTKPNPIHNMLQKLNKNRGGFTLVEIMIVVAIIALLAAIAVPNFLRARKRSQATRILEDLRMIDGALDQYAIENNKGVGFATEWTDVQKYLKVGSALYNSGGKDMLGGTYSGGTFSVDSIPKLDTATYDKLSDIAPGDFWSPFYP
jgi:prepilin-type N-terminal cleavage/methylation domain-containing protein